MAKMKTDLNFLRKTAFKRVLNIKRAKNDPLFISASERTNNEKFSIPLRSFIESRIKNAENLILAESGEAEASFHNNHPVFQ